jgi:hypothetical protein
MTCLSHRVACQGCWLEQMDETPGKRDLHPGNLCRGVSIPFHEPLCQKWYWPIGTHFQICQFIYLSSICLLFTKMIAVDFNSHFFGNTPYWSVIIISALVWVISVDDLHTCSRQLGVISLYSTSKSSQFIAPLACSLTAVDWSRVVWSRPKLSKAANRYVVIYIMIFVCEIHMLCRSFWLVLRILVVKPEFDGGRCLNLPVTNFKWHIFLNCYSAPENNQPQVRKQQS